MLPYIRFVPHISILYILTFLEKHLTCIQLGSTSGYPTDSRQGVLYGNNNSGVNVEPRIGLVRWGSTQTPDCML